MTKGCRNEFPYLERHTLMHIASMVIYTIWILWRTEISQSEEMSLARSAILRNGWSVWSVQFSRPRLMHLNGGIRLQTDGVVN